MYTITETIGPKKAAIYLESNTKNRNLSHRRVAMMVKDMQSGSWNKNHNGIAFFEDGTLADGQHRLHAIVVSGVEVEVLVTRGLPMSAMDTLDSGKTRSIHDSSIMSGRGWSHVVSAMGRMLLSMIESDPSKTQVIQYIDQHEDIFKYADSLFPSKRRGISVSAVLSAVACAKYAKVSDDVLSSFASVLFSGLTKSPVDEGVIALRDRLLSSTQRSGGGAYQIDILHRAQYAIQCVETGKVVKRSFRPKELIYQIPAMGEV